MNFGGFKRNGLQIRIQREKLRISTSTIFWAFSVKCQKMKFQTSNTNWKWGFQASGVSKDDSSWSKAAWSIFQNLFWLENHWPTTWIHCILHCILCLSSMYSMHVFYVCVLCMYSIYICILCVQSVRAYYACILCVYSMHVF